MAERAVRPLQPLPFWLALWVSGAAHLLALAISILLTTVLAEGGGHPEAGGEGGIVGGGGDTFEVSVVEGSPRAPVDGESSVWQHAVPREQAPVPEPATESAPGRGRAAHAVLTARARSRERDEAAAGRAVSNAEQGPAAPAPAEEPAQEASHGVEQGAVATQRGRAAGDPEAAAVILGSVGLGGRGVGPRALLERALECGDPIEGVWVAHRFSPEFHDWARMTLRIERDGDALRGTIVSRTWSGLATDHRPPATCEPGGHDVTVRMQAQGWIRGDEFSFGAHTHEVQRVDCPSPFFSYNPDRFSGRIDTLHETLESVNNDGGRDVNAPYRFRRTACLDGE